MSFLEYIFPTVTTILHGRHYHEDVVTRADFSRLQNRLKMYMKCIKFGNNRKMEASYMYSDEEKTFCIHFFEKRKKKTWLAQAMGNETFYGDGLTKNKDYVRNILWRLFQNTGCYLLPSKVKLLFKIYSCWNLNLSCSSVQDKLQK